MTIIDFSSFSNRISTDYFGDETPDACLKGQFWRHFLKVCSWRFSRRT
jgi:hypothetical protein